MQIQIPVRRENSVPASPFACIVAAGVILSGVSSALARGGCPGDSNGDGAVDAADLGALLTDWGNGAAKSASDLNGDGVVDAADLSAMLAAWGPCVNTPPWATLIEALPDPAIVTDAGLRAAIVASGHPWRVRDNASQVEMLLVPPGTFQMGCSPGDEGQCSTPEYPRHAVTLTHAFYAGRFEVKQSQWTLVMGSNPSYFQSQLEAAEFPVERVSWEMIQGFLGATGTRLPTEAEWEYAYRAGTNTGYHASPTFPNGTHDPAVLGEIAWHEGNNSFPGDSGYGTKRVGQKAANSLGLHDMAGNVWEWIADWYADGYYAASPTTNPQGPASGERRCVRGGSWVTPGSLLRSTNRDHAYPDLVNINLGFRVVRSP